MALFSGSDLPTENNIKPTLMSADGPARLGLVDGTRPMPSSDKNPVLFVQKHTNNDNGTDAMAHNPGGILAEVISHGTGVAGPVDTDATWIAILGNAVLEGANLGGSTPDYDLRGNAVGVAGLARSEKPSDGIVTGLWGYASSPAVDAAEFAASPYLWTICALELNLDIRHPDAGFKTFVGGKGTSVGALLHNYREPSLGVMDWSFGVAFNGSPNDGNWTSPDSGNWSGFRVGVLLDKIKNAGILFGKYIAAAAYGIAFPDSFAGMTTRPKAGIFMGDTQINLGNYQGTTFNVGDLWAKDGAMFYKSNKGSGQVLTGLSVASSLSYAANRKIKVNIGGTDYYLLASTTP